MFVLIISVLLGSGGNGGAFWKDVIDEMLLISVSDILNSWKIVRRVILLT